jgi:hypothetical protein
MKSKARAIRKIKEKSIIKGQSDGKTTTKAASKQKERDSKN